ncbi:hypothetical protein HD554DRAFT_978917 [Boletus coccyginus]|nr:hypothetical protein HD554DRAFT_978917 [Boletus coccyginus]
MFDRTTTGALLLGCVVVTYIARRALGTRASYPLPPGPPGLPCVGNVMGVDASTPRITYTEWARKYGDIVYSWLFGRDIMMILSSEKDCKGSTRKPVQELLGPSLLLYH